MYNPLYCLHRIIKIFCTFILLLLSLNLWMPFICSCKNKLPSINNQLCSSMKRTAARTATLIHKTNWKVCVPWLMQTILLNAQMFWSFTQHAYCQTHDHAYRPVVVTGIEINKTSNSSSIFTIPTQANVNLWKTFQVKKKIYSKIQQSVCISCRFDHINHFHASLQTMNLTTGLKTHWW